MFTACKCVHPKPSAKVCSMLFARDEDELVVSTLFHWVRQGKETRSKLIESLTNVITKAKSKAPRKSSRQTGRGAEQTAPTTRQVLIHLNAFRFFGEKVNFGFYTPTEQELHEYKKHSDKGKFGFVLATDSRKLYSLSTFNLTQT